MMYVEKMTSLLERYNLSFNNMLWRMGVNN